MVSLRRTPDEQVAAYMPQAMNDAAPGLCLSLSQVELEKLGLDDNVAVGDMLHMRIMIEVTAVHKEGNGCTINAAIVSGVAEDEASEDPGDDK
jgi:hypothetical protein